MVGLVSCDGYRVIQWYTACSEIDVMASHIALYCLLPNSRGMITNCALKTPTRPMIDALF
jgi:hypothetical protein